MPVNQQLNQIIAWLAATDPMEDGAVEARARLLFLDTLGCLIAGLAKPEPAALAASLGALEPGSVMLPGAKTPLTASSAAYVAGLAACWDEACEGLPRAHGRPGLHAFAAALALGLARHHSLDETLCALVAGFEVAGRLGEYLRIAPGMHVDGTWGTFGAIAAAARLLALSPDETAAAIQGAACQLPYSLYLPISQGATVRNTYVGEAARRGITCALAVQSGITAPPGAIETFDRLALGVEEAGKALAPAGEWFILQGYLKPFAAVRHVHYGAQAAIDWRRSQGQPDTTKIETLELHIYGEAITYCGNRAPRTPIQAQFSLSYGLAWALYRGDLGPEAYHAGSLNDGEVRRLEALVTIAEEPEFTRVNKRAARLRVDGETFAVDAVPGELELPLSAAEVEAKFVRYVAPVMGRAGAEGLAEGLLRAPLSTALRELFP
jgi:2-methylcitrate dehydratase PrpD